MKLIIQIALGLLLAYATLLAVLGLLVLLAP